MRRAINAICDFAIAVRGHASATRRAVERVGSKPRRQMNFLDFLASLKEPIFIIENNRGELLRK
jgi:hypothetical protein